MLDIYFDNNYGKLYEKIENGEACVYELNTQDGCIKNQFIKRKIPFRIDNNEYYDIITPYGYGGPIITKCVGNKQRLLQQYKDDFKKYCEKNNIISEFIRFHPIFQNALDFKDIYNTIYLRKTLGTNLEKFENPVEEEFSKSCRKTIRQVMKNDIKFNVIKKPKDFREFKRIYSLNMDRKRAEDFYYFDDEYFENIIKYFNDNVIITQAIFNDKIIASGLYFICNGIIHAHLSGTDTEYINLSPAYILKYGTAIWGKENGYKLIHYGGGLTNSEEDSLYKFKRKFAKNTDFDFYIGKKIWNEKVYNMLCAKRNISTEEEFFPAYRMERNKEWIKF